MNKPITDRNHRFLLSERATLNRFIRNTKPEQVITRKSFERRLQQVEEELEAYEKTPPTETPKPSNIVAICYDFDGTLAPGNMQANKFIPNIGINPAKFWREVDDFAEAYNADPTIAYMYMMLQKAKAAGIAVKQENLAEWGKALTFFPEVPNWFNRINLFAGDLDLNLKHYVISSGNAEIIEGCAIAQNFTGIFASRFLYDENGDAFWPAMAMNFTTKTQWIYRINKGAMKSGDRHKINEYLPNKDRPVPFNHIIHIGDGETDIPCFRLTKSQGGYSIAVHDKNEVFAQTLLQQGRVNAIAPTNYQPGIRLSRLICDRLRLIAAKRQLVKTETEAQH